MAATAPVRQPPQHSGRTLCALERWRAPSPLLLCAQDLQRFLNQPTVKGLFNKCEKCDVKDTLGFQLGDRVRRDTWRAGAVTDWTLPRFPNFCSLVRAGELNLRR